MNRDWMVRVASALVAAIAWSQAAGQAPRAPGAVESETPRGDARIGQALAERWCSSCHLVAGAGSATDAAPTFESIAKDPAKTTSHLRGFLSKPHPPMPPIPLSGVEVEGLIAYIRSTAH